MAIDPDQSIRTNAKGRKAAEEATKRIASDPLVQQLVAAREAITVAYGHAISARHLVPTGLEYPIAARACDALVEARSAIDRLLVKRGYQP